MPQKKAAGIWPPVATPFHADLSVDFERHIGFCRSLLADGAHGLAVLGTNSEANSLDLGEREELVDRVVAAGIAPDKLMPGTGATSIGDAVRLTKHAVAHGVIGVLLLPPFYYKNVSDDGLFAFVSEVINRVGSSRLAIYLYHFPQLSGVPWPIPLVGRLLKAFPETVVGLKNSSGEVAYTETLLKEYPDFVVFPGTEALLLNALRKDAAGVISGTANINTAALRRLYDGWRGPGAEALDQTVTAVRRVVEQYPLIPAIKAILADQFGAKEWLHIRPPLRPLDEQKRKELLGALAKLAAKESVPAA